MAAGMKIKIKFSKNKMADFSIKYQIKDGLRRRRHKKNITKYSKILNEIIN